jgi:ATP-dependent Clp protease ATP-binding subunit ClpB
MIRTIALDPNRTGKEATDLESGLRRQIVGRMKPSSRSHGYIKFTVQASLPRDALVANFLFLGPTGSGKTRVVEVTAEALLDNPKAVVKID